MSEREWQVASLNEIAEPGALEFKTGEGDWPFRGFVVRWQGEVRAYQNTCPHAGHALNLVPDRFFNSDNTLLICSSHGALFEPGNGKCVGGPCAGAGLRELVCRIEDGNVWVKAPESLRD